MHQHDQTQKPDDPAAWYKTRWGLALVGFVALSALLLLYEHRLHIPFGNLLVILPLFACIGLHSMMHGGHGGHGGRGGHSGLGGRSGDVTGPATEKPPENSEGGPR